MAESTKTGEAVDAKAFAEVQVQLTELKDALAGSEEKRLEAEGKAQKYQEALDTTNERMAKMEGAARTKRFTELADGHNGPRWMGKANTHVQIMNALGEDSEEYKAYVETQTATAAALKESALFQEVGHDMPAKDENALEKLNKLAIALAEKNPALSPAQAFNDALTQNPQLYDDYRKGA